MNLTPTLVATCVLVSLISPRHVSAQETLYRNGVVVAASAEASEVGVAILRAGGNAVDAAVASAFALAVTHPQAGNLGGGGFAVIHRADGNDYAFDFRETAPARASRTMFLDEKGQVDTEASLQSHRAAGIPGSVDGLLRLATQHGSGKFTWAQLLEPAILLAREGFPLSPTTAEDLNRARARFERQAAARAIFVRADGRPWAVGDRLIQPELAATLDAIATEGRAGFYRGRVAQLLVDEMNRNGGLIGLDDLDEYRTVPRAPLRGSFRGYEIVTMPLPSSGGLLLLQMLGMAELQPLDLIIQSPVLYPHLIAELARRAYADRSQHLGDPAFWEVPERGLLSPEYIGLRARGISLEQATPSAEVAPGDMTPYESDQTTHLSVVDAQGNAVALTTTLNDEFGSALVVTGAGFLLNNEMDDFSASPNSPNLYGLIGGEANSIAPGKRMLSSMAPTVVLRGGRPAFVVGSRGGSRIITSVLQVLLDRYVRGTSGERAVARARVHAQWLPDVLYYEEDALLPETRDKLAAMGHVVQPFTGPWIGQVNAIDITEDGMTPCPDPRGGNQGRGY